MGRMLSINTGEIVAFEKGSEERGSHSVLGVNIEVASHKYGVTNRLDSVSDDSFQGSQSCAELCIPPGGGEVDTNVDSGCEARDGEMEREHSRGGGGENGDKRVNGGVPYCHGATMCSSGGELEVRGEGILSIEVVAVGSGDGDGGEDGGHITGEGLGLTEEDKERMMDGEEVSQGVHIPLQTFAVPSENFEGRCLRRVVGS